MPKQILAFTALLFSIALQAQTPAPQHAARTLVRAGHLVDIRAGRLLDAETLVVSGDRIRADAPEAQDDWQRPAKQKGYDGGGTAHAPESA